VYYKEYKNLEIHFAQTHHICPYESCKAKCYVAFKTEDELKTHFDIEHNQGGGDKAKKGKVAADALLGFKDQTEEAKEDRGGRSTRGGRDNRRETAGRDNGVVIKDKEGIDFNYYFSQKYALMHQNKRQHQRRERGGHEERGRGRGFRGRGRGERGGRGGRGRGRGGHEVDDFQEENHSKPVRGGEGSMADHKTPEEKLSAILEIVSEYIKAKLEKKEW
jgi:hypothetical protein